LPRATTSARRSPRTPDEWTLQLDPDLPRQSDQQHRGRCDRGGPSPKFIVLRVARHRNRDRSAAACRRQPGAKAREHAAGSPESAMCNGRPVAGSPVRPALPKNWTVLSRPSSSGTFGSHFNNVRASAISARRCRGSSVGSSCKSASHLFDFEHLGRDPHRDLVRIVNVHRARDLVGRLHQPDQAVDLSST
jgi:hypothetical protein